MLALTYNYRGNQHELGSAFGHVAIEVLDVTVAFDRVHNADGTVTRESELVESR